MNYLTFSIKNQFGDWSPQLTTGTLDTDQEFGAVANAYDGNPAHPLRLSGMGDWLLTLDCGSATAIALVAAIHTNLLTALGTRELWFAGSNTSRAACGVLTAGTYGSWSRLLLTAYRDSLGLGHQFGAYQDLTKADPLNPTLYSSTGTPNPSFRYWGFVGKGPISAPILGELFASTYRQELTYDWMPGGTISPEEPATEIVVNAGASLFYPTGAYRRVFDAQVIADATLRKLWENGRAVQSLLIPRSVELATLATAGYLEGAWLGRWNQNNFPETFLDNGVSKFAVKWCEDNLGIAWSQL